MDKVPLSQRSAAELHAQADEYRRMAETARTMETFRSLLRLADRFGALAEQCDRDAAIGENRAIEGAGGSGETQG
jgi:hypothetical protein